MTLSPSSQRSRFFIGVDLGQSNDPSTIAVVRRIEFRKRGGGDEKPPLFQVGHLERIPLRTPYPKVVERTQWLMQHPTCRGNAELIVDATGVGKAVADIYRQYGIEFTGVVITAGNIQTNPEPGIWHVPKIELISHLQALLHQGQLQIQKNLVEAETLVRELQDFKVNYSSSGFMSFSARQGKHDDLVLALAIAVWKAKQPLTGGAGWMELIDREYEKAGFIPPTNRTVAAPEFGFEFVSEPFVDVRVPPGPIAAQGGMDVDGCFRSFRRFGNEMTLQVRTKIARELLAQYPAFRAANPELSAKLLREEKND
jgi:hypothetical protein